jgi:site-specific recombinase XerD
MGSTPVVTIFVRHSEGCKYMGEEFSKRCQCRKHLRWTQGGKQKRRMAGTRLWAVAEQKRRDLEDQLVGRERKPDTSGRTIEECVTLFLTDKRTEGTSTSVIARYTRELNRLRAYCERAGIYTVQAVTREILTGFAGTWENEYPSTQTRFQVRARCRSFFLYCYRSHWIPGVPAITKIKAEEPPTMPLTVDEFARILDAVFAVISKPEICARIRALLQLMRWSGLAIQDALTLERAALQRDDAKGIYRIVTSRQKTGIHVSVPISRAIAEELLAVMSDNPKYFFWSGVGKPESAVTWCSNYYIGPIFKAAKIERRGNMVSHRIRDTFAVDLLEKGVPLEEVSKLLGHESIRTTEKSYAKWVQGRQDRLDSLVMGTWATPKTRKRRAG